MTSVRPSDRKFQVVIATAEPRGAYHLEPMYAAMRSSATRFTHLIPYPEPVQGSPWENSTSELSVLETADRIVITGGGYTAWTELVAHRATTLGVEFVITELAYGAVPDLRNHPLPSAMSAMSPAGAELFARYHGVASEDVVITGIPLLDSLPLWEPQERRVLLLSTADAVRQDPTGELRGLADRLTEEGWDVRVRLHPREGTDSWTGHSIDRSPTPAIAAAHAAVVIGYPGSAHAIVAALGVPVVALAPSVAMQEALPPAQRLLIPNWISRASDFDPERLESCSPDHIAHVCGPIGGAAQRVVDFWAR